METFEKSTLIETTAKELFEFHLDPQNLLKITPSNIQTELITKDVQPQEGAVLMIKTTKNFFTFKWIVRIKTLEYPNLFVDEALQSPFAFWEHQHIFEAQGNKTLLKDVVKYRLPFSIIGKLLKGFIQEDLKQMFEYRHKVTKELLEAKK